MNAIANSAAHRAVLRDLAECMQPRRHFEFQGRGDVVTDLIHLGYVRELEVGRGPVEKLLSLAPSGRELLATAS